MTVLVSSASAGASGHWVQSSTPEPLLHSPVITHATAYSVRRSLTEAGSGGPGRLYLEEEVITA